MGEYGANQQVSGNEQGQAFRGAAAAIGQTAGDPWKHRSAGMRCRTCLWFVEKQRTTLAAEGSQTVGRCRRHAPTMNGYPVVYLNDWCGDHRVDENKA